ncbi:MAG: hydantoinase/oxoprolinase N-terminal domain-containing protein, partial [Candidatus Tumulicola sp.]
MSGLRIGIDVGGTFTDVVAIDAGTRALKAAVKVPTTHAAADGVAAGIVAGIERLFQSAGLASEDVAFIAHSTTQATNALLEGDVARVGVIGLLRRNGWLARRHIRFGDVTLAPGSKLDASFRFAAAGDENAIRSAVDAAIADGARAIAASEAFGVDRPRAESFA